MTDKKMDIDRKKCTECKRIKRVQGNFYKSSNKMFDGSSPICIPCIKKMVDHNDTESVHEALRLLDAPFIHSHWEKTLSSGGDVFGGYMRMVNSLHQFRGLTWKNSIFEEDRILNEDFSPKTNNNVLDVSLDFEVTKEMVMRWGRNYDAESYMTLEDFYQKMKDTNRIETPQEEAYLKKLAVISLKMDKELEAGNYQQVKQLGDLFSKYMADGKFRAMDRSEADKTGGIRTFGAIYTEVEKDGHIPPWESYRKIKGLKQDIVDKTIMHILNFTLRLNKIERMAEPPSDTPKLTSEDTDVFSGEIS